MKLVKPKVSPNQTGNPPKFSGSICKEYLTERIEFLEGIRDTINNSN